MAKKLALMLAGVLVALVAAELLVRAAGAAPQVYAIRKGRFQLSHNPKIGYEPVPLVYTGREHAVAKPAGVYRIVVLGDSIAAGLHVERNEDVFPPILERLLVQGGRRAE